MATLPIAVRPLAEAPAGPMTIRSAFSVLAAWQIALAGEPFLTRTESKAMPCAALICLMRALADAVASSILPVSSASMAGRDS